MSALVTNNAYGELLASITDVEQRLLLNGGQGARFPSPIPNKDWFYVTVQGADGSIEIMKCVSRDTDTLTVERAVDGTKAHTFLAGSIVELRPTAGLFNDKVNVDEYNAKMKELDELLKNFRTEIVTMVNSNKAELSAAIKKVETDTAKTYIAAAGGKFTGAVTFAEGVTMSKTLNVTGTSTLTGKLTAKGGIATNTMEATTYTSGKTI